MMKKVLLATIVMCSIAYADTGYNLNYFYGQPKQRRIKKAVYPAKQYSPRPAAFKIRRPSRGLYVEWHGAGRPSWSASPQPSKASTRTANRESPPANASWFDLPFSIPSEKRRGYKGPKPNKKKPQVNKPKLITPIRKNLLAGPAIGWRFTSYFAAEVSGLTLLFPGSYEKGGYERNTLSDTSTPVNTFVYRYGIGAIPSFTPKFIWTYRETEIYGKGGPAFPIAFIQEQGKNNQNGPWTLSVCPRLLLSVGGTYAFTPEWRGELSVNCLVPWPATAETQTSAEEKKLSGFTFDSTKKRNSGLSSPVTKNPPMGEVFTWIQVGASYRFI